MCADDVEERAKEGREQFGFQRHTVRWQEVTAAPDVQVVNVATPNHMHLAVVEAAAAAGKHIFCEKPVGKNPRETAEDRAVGARGWRSHLCRGTTTDGLHWSSTHGS